MPHFAFILACRVTDVVRRPTLLALLTANAIIVVLALGASLASVGCSKEAPQLPALSAEQIAGGAPDIFKGAPAGIAQLAADAIDAIGKRDFTTAWDKLQELNTRPGLTDAQKEFVAQSIASVGAEVQKAGDTGDEAAKKALEFHRANK